MYDRSICRQCNGWGEVVCDCKLRSVDQEEEDGREEGI